VKAQSMGCREIVLTASGDALGLRAGYTFEVEDAPADLPAKYLAIEVRHAGAVSGASTMVKRYTGLDAKETYRVDVVAIPSNVQFRAPQATVWPRIYGFENGSVDGPAESQYAQIDDQGRYLVRFKFDASDLPDGSTSTYLRMMQPHGGTTEGWHFPLRKGTEVMVSFQGGDPDRPVIAGVVPNAVQPSNVTSRNHTQNVLKTGGGNFMVMDDQEGSEYIDTFTPVGSTSLRMGGPFKPTTGPTKWKMTLPPTGATDPPKESDEDFTVFLGTEGSVGIVVNQSWIQNVGGAYLLDVANSVTIHSGAEWTLRTDGAAKEFHNAGYKQTIVGDGEQHVFAKWGHYVSGRNYGHYGQWKFDVDADCTGVVGAAYKLVVGATYTVTAAGNVDIGSAGGRVSLSSPSEISLGAPTINMYAGFIRGIGSSYAEAYGSRSTAGVHKFDYAGIYGCGYGVKLETTGLSMGLYINRGDRAATKNDVIGAVSSAIGTCVTAAGTAIYKAGGLILG